MTSPQVAILMGSDSDLPVMAGVATAFSMPAFDGTSPASAGREAEPLPKASPSPPRSSGRGL